MADRCYQTDIDGEPVVYRGSSPLDEEGQAALAALVRAAKALLEEQEERRTPEERAAIEERRARLRACVERIRRNA